MNHRLSYIVQSFKPGRRKGYQEIQIPSKAYCCRGNCWIPQDQVVQSQQLQSTIEQGETHKAEKSFFPDEFWATKRLTNIL